MRVLLLGPQVLRTVDPNRLHAHCQGTDYIQRGIVSDVQNRLLAAFAAA